MKKPKLPAAKVKKNPMPEGLWSRCPACGELNFNKALDENLKVCPRCQKHFQMSARERVHSLVETCSFEEEGPGLMPVDALRFVDVMPYAKRLAKHQGRTRLNDAVVMGIGRIGERRVALGVMDFGFIGGSMGVVVGEKLCRLIEKATAQELPLIIVAASAGARMQEGTFSLMQMAKTAAALAHYGGCGAPFISVLTDPTLGGVLASFATLGDFIMAEPGAMIGFSGPRVFKDAAQVELPSGFQTAEFLLDHGLIDAVIPRKDLKRRLAEILGFCCGSCSRTGGK